ncbi:hypothetical protein D3C72_1303450 [compost metagenome]
MVNGIVIVLQLQPIQVHVGTYRTETTNIYGIISGRGAAVAHHHARRISQCAFYRIRLAHIHLFTRHDGNRLRSLFNRRVGLGTGGTVFGRVGPYRPPGVFLLRLAAAYHGKGLFLGGGLGIGGKCRHSQRAKGGSDSHR